MMLERCLKVGDTASDIKEGKHAGVWSAGVIVGSSEMGLTEEEYEALSPEEKGGETVNETEEKVSGKPGARHCLPHIRGTESGSDIEERC